MTRDMDRHNDLFHRDASIAIVMATYNGQRFLRDQVKSISRAGPFSIDIWASDDGSTDQTVEVLEQERSGWDRGRFTIMDGPRRGFAENFRSLMCNPKIDGDLVAFSDQDDLWHPDKLREAFTELSKTNGPAMFCSRTRAIDENGKAVGLSPLFSSKPGFRNALVENIASGNTMVFNRAAWELLRTSAQRCVFVYHDWWAYILLTGVGSYCALRVKAARRLSPARRKCNWAQQFDVPKARPYRSAIGRRTHCRE